MRWTIIKQGTDGDFRAPTIIDAKINSDWVAIRRAKEVLYSGQPPLSVRVAYDYYDRGQVCKIGNWYYYIEEVDFSDLPFAVLTLRRLDK